MTYLCINGKVSFPVNAKPCWPSSPQTGLANSAEAKSLATSWKTQRLLLRDRRSPGDVIAFGHVPNDHLKQIRSGPPGAGMCVRGSENRSLNRSQLVPPNRIPVVAAGEAAVEL